MKSSESDFIAECEDILEEAGRLLLEIQESSERGKINPDSINALFRSMHTLKGLAGLFGHDDISDISHSLESLLDDIRLGKSDMTNDAINLFLNFTDTLRNLIATPKEERKGVEEHLEEIEAFRESGKAKPRAEEEKSLLDESIMKVLSEYEEHRLKTNVQEGMGIYMIKPAFLLTEFDTALGELTDRIKAMGELISTMPTTEDVPDGSIGFNLMFGSEELPDALNASLGYDVEELVIAKVEEPTSEAETLQAETSGDVLKMSTSMVRVDINKLDRILNTIGEISLARHAIQRIWAEMTEQYGHSNLVIDIYKVSQNLERKIEELQDQMLEIRMVPVGQIYRRLSQVIRRYSREVGKKIELNMFGEDTEIDKYLAEEIVDPLVHIVRNGIDHGLESPEERVAAGKLEVGNVTLKAFQRGNHVVLEVSDDGAGIDPEKLKKRAIEKGLIGVDTELTEKDMMDLMFMPGFSTKDVVSEVSGRGVGLDIVRDKVSSMGGFVDVKSEKGLGTIFSLTVPITLAIIKVLMVRVGSETFGVPLSSISETLTISHDSLQSIENRKVFNLRGEMLPVTWLKNTFGISGDDGERSFAVIVGFGERRMGLLVDELLGQNEIVIKSVGDYLDDIKGLAGAAEVGRHEIVLVLDVEGIIEECTARRGALHV
jgi:two-component system chemotaxis sensor kinase CheA